MHYSLVAVDFMSEDALHAALTHVAGLAASGRVQPLLFIQHSINEVAGALRQMSQARHVGKVVVRMPESEGDVKPAGHVLVTGDRLEGLFKGSVLSLLIQLQWQAKKKL